MPLVEFRSDYMLNLRERIKWFGRVMVERNLEELPFFVNVGREFEFFLDAPKPVKNLLIAVYGEYIMRRDNSTGGGTLRIRMRGARVVYREDWELEYTASENDIVYLYFERGDERVEKYFIARYGERGSTSDGVRYANLVPVRLKRAYHLDNSIPISDNAEVVISTPTYVSLYIMYYPILRQF